MLKLDPEAPLRDANKAEKLVKRCRMDVNLA